VSVVVSSAEALFTPAAEPNETTIAADRAAAKIPLICFLIIISYLSILMYSRYLLKTSHFGCIPDKLFLFSRRTHRVRIHTLYVLRKCHCISKIHLEILRSEDSESTLLLGTVPLVSSIITFSYVKKTTLNLIIVALKIRLFE
jgi:hypothetical protein